MEIKNFDGKVLYTSDRETLKDALVEAVSKGAKLSVAKLGRANLCGANLRGANLYGADLEGADFRGANLQDAYLRGACLRGADLCGANLRGANLQDANLQDAYLRYADLCGADLEGANLRGAKLGHFSIVPEEGNFIGWKKLKNGAIAKLEIREDARRVSSLVGRKCRAEYVKVLAIEGAESGYSRHDGKTLYEVGKIVRADKFDDDIRVECTHGIHFFITRREAEEY